MFKVATDPTFTHNIKVNVPIDDGHETHELRTTFRVLDDEISDPETVADLAAFLDRAVVTFEDLSDDNDAPMTCTEEVRAKLLTRPFVRLALWNGYRNAMVHARLGN